MKKSALFICKNNGTDQLGGIHTAHHRLSSGKHVHVMYTTLHPNFIKLNWGLQGYTIFLIFALKHILWVLVRIASLPTIYVLSKNKKNVTFFHLKITIFTAVKYCSILHGHVCVIVFAT